jgi:hypothetical protein
MALRRSIVSILGLIGLVLCSADCTPTKAADQSFSILHYFSLWGELESPSARFAMYVGFTNGLFIHRGSPAFSDFADCLSTIPPKQAIAMIDKFYKDNPQKWNTSLSEEIIAALIVPDGPCSGKDPWK